MAGTDTQALDLSFFPLVVLVMPKTVDSAFADTLEEDHRVLFRRRERYVSVTDLSQVSGMPDAKTRKSMGEWAKSHEDDLKQWQVANALVVNSTLVRGGLSAIHWFAPPPVPTAVETHLSAALAFLRKHAELASLSTLGLSAYESAHAERRAR